MRSLRSAPVVLLLLNLSAVWPSGQRGAPPELAERVARHLARLEPELIAFRRDLHRHPELSGNEVRTAAAVAERLRAAGLEVRTGVGGHGVVGVLRGGRPGPVVAYRADMDAVIDRSPDPVAFASVVPGVRHICGHDVHTTIGVALATALAAERGELAGTVLFLFQPAEERADGARAMLADGVFGAFRPVAIYALHTAPMPVGRLATAAGVTMPARDRVVVTLRGTGDLEAAAGRVLLLLRSLGTVPPEARFAPADTMVVLAEARALPPANGEATVLATLTVGSEAARAGARARLAQGLDSLGVSGIVAALEYRAREIAGVTNAPELVRQGNAAIARALGNDTAVATVRSLIPAFSEDFGAFQAEVPGVMWFLGVSNPARGTVGMPHAPNYVADEGAIVVGARAMGAVLLARLTAP